MRSTQSLIGTTTDIRARLDSRFRKPLMTFFLRRVKDRSEAEDLTQEVFVRTISAAGLGQIEQADAYVFKVAANLLRDHGRRHLRHWPHRKVPIDDALIDEVEAELLEERNPERVLLSKDSLADVLRALDELEPRTRDIFILFRLENMKQKDIAALYGIAQSTVEKNVMRAVLHLTHRCNRK